MNILFLTTHLNTGGITVYVLSLAKGLRALGHNVTVVSSGGNLSQEFSRHGISLIVLNIRTRSEINPRLYTSLPGLVRCIRDDRIDIIHSQTRVTQVMGQALHLMTGKPLITTCHGFYKIRFFRRIFPCWGQKTIAISKAVKRHLEADFHVPPSRIALVRNGIDIKDFPPVEDHIRKAKQRELNIHGRVIGIIARLADVKGHAVLIQAMRKISDQRPDVRLLIVGEGKMEHELKEQVRVLRLEQHVIFLPVVQKTAQYLTALDIFAQPSLSEGLGISIMEAQAVGLPVVASRVGGIPSLIEHEKTGILVEPNDSQAMAEALLDLLENPEKARRLGLAAREFIARECTVEKMVEETVEAYKNLIADSV